jgi:hypothetical protein
VLAQILNVDFSTACIKVFVTHKFKRESKEAIMFARNLAELKTEGMVFKRASERKDVSTGTPYEDLINPNVSKKDQDSNMEKFIDTKE